MPIVRSPKRPVLVPREMLENEKIPYAAMLLWGVLEKEQICMSAYGKESYRLNNIYLANILRTSPRTIQRWLKILQTEKWIEIEMVRGGYNNTELTRIITLNFDQIN